MRTLTWCWWKIVALVRRLWLAIAHVNEPWDPMVLDLKSPAVRRMIARALWNERRERYGMVCWSYYRDRAAERRELKLESSEKKAARLVAAFKDRYPLRMVV